MSSEEMISDRNVNRKKSSGPLDVEIITDENGFNTIANEWRSLVESANVYIFQTYEWQRTWWKIFGSNNVLHIILLRDQERLVGILPMFVDFYRVWGKSIYRSLRMMGSRIIQPQGDSVPLELAFSDYLTRIAHPQYEAEVDMAFQRYLGKHAHQFDEILFEEIPEDNAIFTSLLPLFDQKEWQYEIVDASVCPKIELPSTMNELLGNLSSNARYQIRRDIRRGTNGKIFERRRAQSEKEVEDAFQILVHFHQQRWHNLGQPGIFTDARLLRFYREITFLFHKRGWLAFDSLFADDQCVAIDLLFKFKKTLYMMQRGFDDASPYNQYGPGNVLLYTVIKEAIDEGLLVYDFLRGEENYKLRTANKFQQNKEVVLRTRNQSKVRLGWCRGIRNYAHLKRKLSNEKYVIGVYFKLHKPGVALGSYVREVYHRGVRKFKKSV